MGEYIDRKQALDALLFSMCGSGYQTLAVREIKAISAEDVAPVVHGRWRLVGADKWNDCYECSECGHMHMDDSKYCPFCGAKMDKEER